VVPNDLRSAKSCEHRILSELSRHGYDEETKFAIKLALEEALTNAVKHGNGNDRSKKIVIAYAVNPQRAVLGVRDEGNGFRLDQLPDPTADENLERPSGRGIMLMQAYMTRLCFNDVGNEVWMLKKNPRGEGRHPARQRGRKP
jgi:serine/threonine-protein kinase RsbW